MRIKNLLIATCLTGGVLALGPASASAAYTIGSITPATGTGAGLPFHEACVNSGGCTAFNTALPNGQVAVAGDHGVITSWRVRQAGGPIHLAVVGGSDVAHRVVAARSAAEMGDDSLKQTFPTRLPIEAGQFVALEGATGARISLQVSPHAMEEYFEPAIAPGLAGVYKTNQVLVEATVEPDTNHNGLGDETQDLKGIVRDPVGALKRLLLSLLKLHP